MSEIALRFDYNSLSGGVATEVSRRTKDIKALTKRAASDVITIGRELAAVKEALPHGKFLDWLHVEFAWSERTARNLMRVADKFKTANVADLDFAPSALYLLSEESVAESAVTEAVEKAKSGEKITHREAKRIVAKHNPPKSEPSPPVATKPKTTEVNGVSWVETEEESAPVLTDEDWNDAESELKVEKDKRARALAYLKAADKSLGALQDNCLNSTRVGAKLDLNAINSHCKAIHAVIEKGRAAK